MPWLIKVWAVVYISGIVLASVGLIIANCIVQGERRRQEEGSDERR